MADTAAETAATAAAIRKEFGVDKEASDTGTATPAVSVANRAEATRANALARDHLERDPQGQFRRAERILHKSLRMWPKDQGNAEGAALLERVLVLRAEERARAAAGAGAAGSNTTSPSATKTDAPFNDMPAPQARPGRVARGNPGANGLRAVAWGGTFLASCAHQFGSKFRIVAILAPLGSMSCVLWTLATCYYMWRTGPNLRDPRVIFPAISELGASMPEHRVYQVGFAVTGALLTVHIWLFSQLVLPRLLEYGNSELQQHADSAVNWGYVSAAGVVLQGVFTLELKLSAQSCIHWAGAIAFMSGAMNHAQESKQLYDGALELTDHVPLLRHGALLNTVEVRRFIVDYSSVFMFLPIILAQVLFASGGPPPAIPAPPAGASAAERQRHAALVQQQENAPDPKMMNTMGVMQWAIILQFAVYFCTYAVDLWFAVQEQQMDAKAHRE